MKKIISIASALALTLANGYASPSNSHNVDTIPTATDTISTLEVNDSMLTISEQNQAKVVSTEDGATFVLYNGASYQLIDILNSHTVGNGEVNEIDFEKEAESYVNGWSSWGILGALLICFGIPSILIFVALYMILKFFTRRNRERNALIAQAIDSGYQLPDSFYLNQRNEIESNGSSANGMQRDPQKFQSAITMIAAGIALGAFFWVIEAPFGFIAGGIPLLLGIGQLIGYFYIPGFGATTNKGRNNQSVNRPYQSSINNGQNCPPSPPSEQFYYDPRDPRYNGNR